VQLEIPLLYNNRVKQMFSRSRTAGRIGNVTPERRHIRIANGILACYKQDIEITIAVGVDNEWKV